MLVFAQVPTVSTLSFHILAMHVKTALLHHVSQLTAKLVANMLVKAGVDRVLTLDLHAVLGARLLWYSCWQPLYSSSFAKHYCDKGILGSDVVVVSPKNSGVKRARSLAEYLDVLSPLSTTLKTMQPRNEGYIIGDVEGKKLFWIDDILNTGRTFSGSC